MGYEHYESHLLSFCLISLFSPPVFWSFSFSLSPNSPYQEKRTQWTAGLIMLSSNTFCLPLYVLQLLQDSLAASLERGKQNSTYICGLAVLLRSCPFYTIVMAVCMI